MKKKLLSKPFLICLNILWTIVILVLCFMPGEKIPNPQFDIPHLDKVVHAGMFFISTVLMIFPIQRFEHLSYWKICLIVIIYAAILGGTIEYLQGTYFHRNGDLWDFAADISGGIIACLCYPKLKQILY